MRKHFETFAFNGKVRFAAIVMYHCGFSALFIWLLLGPPSEVLRATELVYETLIVGAIVWFVYLALETPPYYLEFVHGSVEITLTPGTIEGQGLFGGPHFLKTKAVTTIQPTRKYWGSSAKVHLRILDHSGNSLVIHHNVRHLKECINTIKEVCPNLDQIDLGGLDNTKYWTEIDKIK